MMRTAWFVVGFALLFVAQPPEQYPGQSEHRPPPKNYYCSNHPNAPAAHKCACQRKCSKPRDEEGNEIPGPLVIEEDRACSVWCFADHCACAVKCGETH